MKWKRREKQSRVKEWKANERKRAGVVKNDRMRRALRRQGREANESAG